MKETEKSLVVVLFVLGAMVMGISCQKDAPATMDSINSNDFKLAAGIYDVESVVTLGGKGDIGIEILNVTKGTLEIKGSNPDSKVIQKIEAFEVVWKITDDNIWASYAAFDDATLSAMMGESGTIVKDNAKKTITISMDVPEEDSILEGTYAEFITDAFERCSIKQNASGTKTVIEGKVETGKMVATITRK